MKDEEPSPGHVTSPPFVRLPGALILWGLGGVSSYVTVVSTLNARPGSPGYFGNMLFLLLIFGSLGAILVSLGFGLLFDDSRYACGSCGVYWGAIGTLLLATFLRAGSVTGGGALLVLGLATLAASLLWIVARADATPVGDPPQDADAVEPSHSANRWAVWVLGFLLLASVALAVAQGAAWWLTRTTPEPTSPAAADPDPDPSAFDPTRVERE